MTDKKPVLYDEIQLREIQDHIDLHWGESKNGGMICRETVSEYVRTDVQMLGGEGEEKAFVTFGAGARKTRSPLPAFGRVEYVMYASKGLSAGRAPLAAAELQSLGKYPFRNDTWFGPGHTVKASGAFSKEFGYRYFLFIETCQAARLSRIGEVNFLVAVPVYEEERDWMASREDGSWRFLAACFGEVENKRLDDFTNIDVPRALILPEE